MQETALKTKKALGLLTEVIASHAPNLKDSEYGAKRMFSTGVALGFSIAFEAFELDGDFERLRAEVGEFAKLFGFTDDCDVIRSMYDRIDAEEERVVNRVCVEVQSIVQDKGIPSDGILAGAGAGI